MRASEWGEARKNILKMHRLGICTILTLFLVHASGDENWGKKENLSSGNETENPIDGSTVRSKKNSTDRRKNQLVSQYWMNVYGPLQHDLFAAQAVIVKEEAFDSKCEKGDRRSLKLFHIDYSVDGISCRVFHFQKFL